MTSSKNADALIADRVEGIFQNEPLALRALIHRLETPPYEWPADDILAIVEEHKPAILKYIDRKFRVGNISLPVNDIKKLLSVDATWPELPDLINKYKPSIVKKLLEMLKEGDYKTAVDPINTITAMGVGWPELGIMQRSIDARKKHVSESWSDDDESIEEIKANILHDLRDTYYIAVIDALDYLKDYDDLGDISRIVTELERHKDGIMRKMLHMIKDHGLKHCVSFLDGLKRFGIKWPELDVIRKSANSNNKPIAEANHELNAASYKVNIAGAVLRNDIDTLVEELAEFAWVSREHIGDVAKLTSILEQHKTRVMKGLLSYMRELDDNGIVYIMPQIIAGLENANITWPELSIIDRSVDKIQRRIEAEEEANYDTP